MALSTAMFPGQMMNSSKPSSVLRFPGQMTNSSQPSSVKRRKQATIARYTKQNSESKQAFSGDSYLTLGLRPGSSKKDIKQAYRRLALQYHPDVCKGDHCAPKFKQICAAYEVLQKAGEQSPNSAKPFDDYWSDEDEEEEYKAGWEGAWVY